MPPRTGARGERIDARGAYLVDDGYQCLLWLGKMLDPAFVQAAFGPTGPPGPDVDFEPPVVADSKVNEQVRGVVAEVRASGERVPLHADGDPTGEPQRGASVPAPRRGSGRGGRGCDELRRLLIQLHRQVAQSGAHQR